MILTSVITTILIVFAATRILGENSHLAAAKKQIQAGNFDSGASECRLCLQEDEDNLEAKGLLAYSVMRSTIESEVSQSDDELSPENKALGSVLDGYKYFGLESALDSIKNEKHRKRLENEVKDFKNRLKTTLKNNRVPIGDWDEFNRALTKVAETIFKSKASSENALDERFRDISAAILARSGDKSAGEYLIRRCAENSDLISLTIIAGSSIEKSLEETANKKTSFLMEDGKKVLRLLRLQPHIKNFAESDPSLRIGKSTDLPKDQRSLINDDFFPFLTEPASLVSLTIDSLRGTSHDPSAIYITSIEDENLYICVLSSYSYKKGKFVCQALKWDGSQFTPLKLNETSETFITHSLPIGQQVAYNKDTKEFRVGVLRMGEVDHRREEERYRTVTKYRQEMRYNGYGYENVSVPYYDTEPYLATVSYKEREQGLLWIIYHVEDSALSEQRRLWVADSQSFEDIDKNGQPKIRTAEAESKKRDKFVTWNRSALLTSRPEIIDRIILRFMSEALVRADLEDFDAGELRIIRNGFYARAGYAFKSEELRNYFQTRSWYRPVITNYDSIEDNLTQTQKDNFDLIKLLEREKTGH